MKQGKGKENQGRGRGVLYGEQPWKQFYIGGYVPRIMKAEVSQTL